jgi:hypothetical protein
LAIKIEVTLCCDGCKRKLRLAGRSHTNRRGHEYTHLDDIYVMGTGELENTLSITKGGELSWLKELGTGTVNIACSHECVAKLLPKWMRRLDREFEQE